MKTPIAIVGMGCRYPDASDPRQLWENALARRRSFRRIPAERLRLEDYHSEDANASDSTYLTQAAVLADYQFDRTKFHVAGPVFRAADMAHWLALDVASDALRDAGFENGSGLPGEATGVLLGNSLTGEFSRAGQMRLRWPYVRRTVAASLEESGIDADEIDQILRRLERQYKQPFPVPSDESLAGGLSNTIAGRICNHFDFHGGGYTIDAACASSLLAVANACSALTAGDLDVALAGGVDLSLDPFELVGFSRVGALARDDMRVYDRRSAGFWPGEGCGMVVLMRADDALAQQRRIYSLIQGWGVSSDGAGGLTRPEIAGHQLALQRAYRRAGFGIGSIDYFEGHGTGTAVGDPTEIRAIARARYADEASAPPAAIGSIKANIGHTKAAAGVAGLIKTSQAVYHQVVPLTTGYEQPHPVFAEENGVLELRDESRVWSSERPIRAAVSAMGFGGINTHVVLESAANSRRSKFDARERRLAHAHQDVELFLFGASDGASLREQVNNVGDYAARLSRSELTDLAARLAGDLSPTHHRAAVVASTPAELAKSLALLEQWLDDEVTQRIDTQKGVMLGQGWRRPRIGLLFPGQGSPANLDGGIWKRRFSSVSRLYEQAELPLDSDGVATEVAQPAIVTASMAALRVFSQLGIGPCCAIGHSLGELAAYCWAGAYDEQSLLSIARARGNAIASCDCIKGSMASIAANCQKVGELIEETGAVIASMNSPEQTVVSGASSAIEEVLERAQAQGISIVKLRVSHAFHSPLVKDATIPLTRHLKNISFARLNREISSTITGGRLAYDADLIELLDTQMTSPVRLTEAVESVRDHVDLWIEAGPGEVLSGMVRRLVDVPVVSADAGSHSLRGLMHSVGAAFALGAPIAQEALFGDRFTRPFSLDWRPSFLANPCEQAPDVDAAPPMPPDSQSVPNSALLAPDLSQNEQNKSDEPLSVKDTLVRLIAQRTELPLESISDDQRLLSDLHLSSIAVGQLLAEATQVLGLPAPVGPTAAADATVAEVAATLQQIQLSDSAALPRPAPQVPPGVDSWVRTFEPRMVQRPQPIAAHPVPNGVWTVIASGGDTLARELENALSAGGLGSGVAICLPPPEKEPAIDLMLRGIGALRTGPGVDRLLVVQHGGGGAALAKSLHQELPGLTTCVIDLPAEHSRSLDWIISECRAARAYHEVHYDDAGVRREPVLELLVTEGNSSASSLGGDDVILITGGGKGIAAECGLAVAKASGAKLALLGRSLPSENAELAANLERIRAGGIACQYVAADVTDAMAVNRAIEEIRNEFGQVTAIIHGAGVNRPHALADVDEASFRDTLAPKLAGLRNVLSAIDPKAVRLLVTFSSIIGRVGMQGEVEYAVANEWLTDLTRHWGEQNSHCRSLALEWSVWSGVGMGEKLGSLESLVHQGISPISVDAGTDTLLRLLDSNTPDGPVVIAGRFGDPVTVDMTRSELPLRRFLEHTCVYVPGVELIVEADLSSDSDPYLNDHVFQDVLLLPAVMGFEAMAQTAMALSESSELPQFCDTELLRPIAIPDVGSRKLRIAALARTSTDIEVVIRSEETDFQVDHFRAICRFTLEEDRPSAESRLLSRAGDNGAVLSLDPATDLYGSVLFHEGRFRRLRGYRWLKATECVAEITSDTKANWFGSYLPGELTLGDPAVRDTAIHCIQACIPHGTLLPIGIEQIRCAKLAGQGPFFVRAEQTHHEGDIYVYDLDITLADGTVCESWRGLKLKRVRDWFPRGPWCIDLLEPYLQRRLDELLPSVPTAVAIRASGGDANGSHKAILRAIGQDKEVFHRPDGKPEIIDGPNGSASGCSSIVLSVASEQSVSCDTEPVTHRDEQIWRRMLGAERFELAEFISRETSDDSDTAATRVWAASECLTKAQAPLDHPLVFRSSTTDNWVLLDAGSLTIATCVAAVNGEDSPLTIAVLASVGNTPE